MKSSEGGESLLEETQLPVFTSSFSSPFSCSVETVVGV